MLLALFAAAYLLPAMGIGVLILALGLMGLIEYDRLLRQAGVDVFSKTMSLGAFLITGAAFADLQGLGPAAKATGFSWEISALGAMMILIFVQALCRAPERQTMIAAAATLMGLLYLPLLLNFHMRLALTDMTPAGAPSATGRILALFPIVVVKVSDMGAFFAGRRFGRRKLCPALSPGKTVEGLLGGLAAAIVVALGFAFFIDLPSVSLNALWRPLPLALSAVILTFFGIAGDLGESFIKRVAEVKDSSSVLPGMGGLLDVLDSLLFSAPAFYLIVRLFPT